MEKKNERSESQLLLQEMEANVEMREAELELTRDDIKRQKAIAEVKLKHDKMECSRRNIECLCKLINSQHSMEIEACSNEIINDILVKNVKILGNVDK